MSLAATASDTIAVAGAVQANTALVIHRRDRTGRKPSYMLDVYRASSGARLHSWKLDGPPSARIQIYGRLAIYRSTVIRLEDGRRARLPPATLNGNSFVSQDRDEKYLSRPRRAHIHNCKRRKSHHDLTLTDGAARCTRGSRHPASLNAVHAASRCSLEASTRTSIIFLGAGIRRAG